MSDLKSDSKTPTQCKNIKAFSSIDDVIDQLKHVVAFQKYTDIELAKIAKIVKPITIPAHEQFIEQNKPASFFYIILSGRANVHITIDDDELTLDDIHPGELVGESEYFENKVRTASVCAIEEITAFRIDYKELPKLFDEIPGLYNSILSIRLKETDSRFRKSLERRRTVERSLKHLNEFLDLSDMSCLDEGSEGLIERIVSMASKVMKADRASLFLVDQLTGDLWSKVAEGIVSKKIIVPKGTGLAGWVLLHREILNIDDVYKDSRFNKSIDIATNYRTKTMLCGPIVNPVGKVIGVIQVINKLKGEFNTEDINLFKAFAHQSAVAVENFYLFRRVMSSNDKLAIMLDVLDSVTRTSDMPSLISKIVEKTIEIMQCERASFFIYDRAVNDLWSLKASGDGMKEIRFSAAKGIGGYAATYNEIVNVEDAYNDHRFNPEIDKVTGYQTRSILASPVLDRDNQVVGVAQAINKKGDVFNAEDIELIKAISSQIGEALKKNALLHNLQESKDKLEEYNQNLELKVQQRTDDLVKAYEDLQNVNRDLHQGNIELKRLSHKKSEFLGIAAHDLKNPLGGIAGLAELTGESMKASNQDDTTAKNNLEMVETIEESAKHMLEVIDHLMNSEALETGKITVKCQEYCLNEIAKQVVSLNLNQALSKKIELIFDDSDKCVAMIDLLRMREVMDNLVSNAVKYSPPGKKVWVSVKHASENNNKVIRFSVKDEGPGLTDEDKEKLFGKFQKLTARPTGGEYSSGLGLSIVKTLVELQNGEVYAVSEAGKGAEFIVDLPDFIKS